jgi:plastocyanin
MDFNAHGLDPGMERREFLAGVGSAAAATTLAGCAGGSEDGGMPAGDVVAMVGATTPYYFTPIGMHVDPGTTVTFRNRSGSHSATAYDDRIPESAEPWDSGVRSGDDTFEHTFEVEGTYDYFCIPHRGYGMVGRIVVGSPGGPAEGSQPPQGAVPESDRIVEEGKVAGAEF